MELAQIQDLLAKISGCTFASLDAETSPSAGITKTVKRERVILFTNKTGSGYERMVRRRLEEIGKDPSSFVVNDLPWGERLPDSPIIYHREKDRYYLQTILLAPGEVQAFMCGKEIDPSILEKRRSNNQGLPDDRKVVVKAYALESILAIRLIGSEIIA